MFTRTQEVRVGTDKLDQPFDYSVMVCRWKGIAIAVFSKDDQDGQVDAYLKTHAYLAEWSSQWMQGNKVNWDDTMFVAYPEKQNG